MISLVVVTYNEEHRILGCLRNANQICAELVVVDQQSTDRTVDIAKDYGAMVISDEHHGFCEPSRQMGLDHSIGDWILILDADEEITPQFVADVPNIQRLWDGADMATAHFIGGRRMFANKRHNQYRFFKRNHVILPTTLHSRPQPTPGSKVFETPYFAIHHAKSLEEHDADVQRYGRLGA